MDKRPMKTINLKKYYYPICKKDTFVEVPDEVADAIVEESRAENANDAKQHYHCYRLCVPVRFTGENFRQETAQRKMKSMKKLIAD